MYEIAPHGMVSYAGRQSKPARGWKRFFFFGLRQKSHSGYWLKPSGEKEGSYPASLTIDARATRSRLRTTFFVQVAQFWELKTPLSLKN